MYGSDAAAKAPTTQAGSLRPVEGFAAQLSSSLVSTDDEPSIRLYPSSNGAIRFARARSLLTCRVVSPYASFPALQFDFLDTAPSSDIDSPYSIMVFDCWKTTSDERGSEPQRLAENCARSESS